MFLKKPSVVMSAFAAVGVALSGCGDMEEVSPAEPQELEVEESELFVDSDMSGGTGVNEGVIDHQTWQATQYLGTPASSSGFCTATYLKRSSSDEPPVIATAAHCVLTGSSYPKSIIPAEDIGFALYYDTATSPAHPGVTPITQRRFYPAAEVLVRPEKLNGSGNSGTDVAYVVLREVPRLLNGQELEGVEFLDRIPVTGTGAHQGNPGDFVMLVGQGARSTGSSAISDGRRREGRAYLTGIFTDALGATLSRIGEQWGYDSNGNAEVRYGAALMPGDSGGPLFVRDNGVDKIAGVACCGSADLDPTNISTSPGWAAVYNHSSNPNWPWLSSNRYGAVGAHGFDDDDTVRNASGDLLLYPKASTRTSDLGSKVDEDMYFLGWYGAGHQIIVDVLFLHASQDIDVELISGEWNYKLPPHVDQWNSQASEQVAQSVSDDESINFVTTKSLRPYYMRVYPYSGNSANYRMVRCDGDGYSNVDFANAETLTSSVSERAACTFSKYFAFTKQAGQTDINATFEVAYGDLDLALYDANEQLITRSTSGADNETLDISSLTNGATYYVEVYDYQGINGNTFDLEIQ